MKEFASAPPAETSLELALPAEAALRPVWGDRSFLIWPRRKTLSLLREPLDGKYLEDIAGGAT